MTPSALLLAGLFLPAAMPNEEANQKEMAKLEGTWVVQMPPRGHVLRFVHSRFSNPA